MKEPHIATTDLRSRGEPPSYSVWEVSGQEYARFMPESKAIPSSVCCNNADDLPRMKELRAGRVEPLPRANGSLKIGCVLQYVVELSGAVAGRRGWISKSLSPL
jgi:hypothetical protein